MFAQQTDFQKMNPEQKYQLTRELAFSGKYNDARQLGFKILDSIPKFDDVSLLIARTYLWEAKYDSAQKYIDKVLTNNPDNIEAQEAQLDLAYFSGNMPVAEKLALQMLGSNPDNIKYREKYALALLANEQKQQAVNQADSILNRDSLNVVANDIKNQLKPRKKLTHVSVGYSFDHFSEPYSRWWHLFTAGVQKPVKWGSIGGRLNIGQLYPKRSSFVESTEWQLEAESYINLTKASYGMLLYGYSPHNHFPTHKAAAEIWHKLPAAFIASIGINYYNWDENHIYIGTASLEKYLGKYWFCLRGYAHFKDVGVTGSYYLTGRRYFNEIDFFQVTLGMGTAPDEPFDIKNDLERQSAYSIRTMYCKKIAEQWTLKAGLGYAYEEYSSEKYRNRYDGTISFIYSFGK